MSSRAPKLVALLVALTFAVGCAHTPRPSAMREVDQLREGQAVARAKLHAPQAYARAELLRRQAELAYAENDLSGAQILGERAMGAYVRATIEARLAVAEAQLAEARLAKKSQEARLAQLDAEQQRLAADAVDLELRAKVARDAEPLAKNEPASPERERARREAARAIVTQASLLCVSANLVEPSRAALPGLVAKTDELRKRLSTPAGPAPIDDATSLRSACLRELTLARRPRMQGNPSRGESDALLAELSRADFLPFRDDRGVVLVLRDLLEAGKPNAKSLERLSELGRFAKAHPEFPVLVVVHTAREADKLAPAPLGSQVESALRAAGAARVDVREAGSTSPVVPKERAGAANRNERVEIVFVSPGT